MEADRESGTSISASALRRLAATRQADRWLPVVQGEVALARICAAMRERWQVDVTMRHETIFFEARDLDTCSIRQPAGTLIERCMHAVDDDGAVHALTMNLMLCRRGFLFGTRGPLLVLHRYVAPWETFETCMDAIHDFLHVSDRVKRVVMSS